MNNDINTEKVNFLSKVFFYENPKKSLIKSIIILVLFLLITILFLISGFTNFSVFFGILSLFILARVFEDLKRIKDEK